MKVNNLINKLKENNQDFEWYATSSSMIETVVKDYIKREGNNYRASCVNNFSLLDIGAGNGNVFNLFEDYLPKPKDQYTHKTTITKYAIEKSEILIGNMKDDIMILGTDFHNQTLIDKQVDVIFCNPPYKEFKQWMSKIIQEANCKYIYFVVPERWKQDKQILTLLNDRIGKQDLNINDDNFIFGSLKDNLSIISNDSFLDSDYRKARAVVDIIRIELYKTNYDKVDPFDTWFNNNFKIKADKSNDYSSEYKATEQKKADIKNNLVKGKNLIESLEELYLKDFDNLLTTYKQLETIDASLLKELGVNINTVKEGLKNKIASLKSLYWYELFDNLNKITDKLTSKSRKQILDTLTKHTSIDFTSSNAYALLIWVLKNANIYIDEQLKDVYFDMASKDNIINYKSNKVFIEDTYRYRQSMCDKTLTHFKLDYRLVFSKHNCFNNGNWNSSYSNGLNKNIHDFLNDMCTIGNNLGFNVITSSYNFDWEAGKENTFYFIDNNKQVEFMKIRCYQNGNVHCKPNQEFIKSLNIEMARLNGWLKDETEISKELDLDIQDVQKYYKTNKKFINDNIKLLLTC